MKVLQQPPLTIVLTVIYASISFSATANTSQSTSSDHPKAMMSGAAYKFTVNEEPDVVIPKLSTPDIVNAKNSDNSPDDTSATEPRTAKPLASNPTLFLEHITKSENQFIPVIQDAIIFANFGDELPAIVNYYTFANQAHIIKFYQEAYGELVSQDTQYGRLTLHFRANEQQIRVIISPQDKKQQVDVIVTLLDKNTLL
ncbi:hypothetical protein KO495_10780 [Colwellia sp. D2M02]|uniref:hypothetical protein n=1 Tax=Colwellia sp. D2M02 TaxID=2841562 RepID=UPI001C08CF08|nr:hypothetical protein [Colwellia sp. D2M02]MBU2893806.1 hypothetical protein [Colwellia sp. D2M02]